MRCLKLLPFTLCFFSLLLSCGSFTSNDEIKKSDKKRAEVEVENKNLKEKNQALESLLQNVFVTTNNIWALTKAFVDYTAAESSCTDIGYNLANATQFAEFKIEVYDTKADWQEISIDRFHRKDVTRELAAGFAVCRRDHIKSVADVID